MIHNFTSSLTTHDDDDVDDDDEQGVEGDLRAGTTAAGTESEFCDDHNYELLQPHCANIKGWQARRLCEIFTQPMPHVAKALTS